MQCLNKVTQLVPWAQFASISIDELHTLASTVETWWPEIEAFIDTGITNARPRA